MSELARSYKIKDRPEYDVKPPPLTFTPEDLVSVAVEKMAEKNFGSVIIVDANRKILGIVTERDILKRLVRKGLDPSQTKLEEIMTRNPRVARADDDLLNWLRIMSNERFRRLPVIDENDQVTMVFSQGDFVSYTWPDLLFQAKQITKATVIDHFPVFLIGGGVLVYTALVALIFKVM